jgi:glycosyltransferase involved in cell wall biosynthesis
MKILMFSGDYWPNEGGIATHVCEVSPALAARGASVTVVGGHRGTRPASRGGAAVSSAGLREILIARKGPRLVRGLVFLIEAFARLIQLAREEWDVVHFHNFFPDGLLLGIAGWPRSKVRVMTNHSSQYLEAVARGQSLVPHRLLTRCVTGFVAPSRELAQRTARIMRSRQTVRCIPNGVDVMRFAPGAPTQRAFEILGADRHSTVVMAIRRHSPKCGLDYLIRAAPEIVRQHPEVVICLVGSGELTSELKRLAWELGMQPHITFPGRVYHDTLPDLLRAAYLTVLPSLYEAVSLAGLESMACGVPVIGTRVGGIPEFVDDGKTGFLVEPRSESAIATAVLRLLADPELRHEMSAACRTLVREKFTWDCVARQLLEFYSDLRIGHDTKGHATP